MKQYGRHGWRFEIKYSPDQPRVPAGSSEGGQWTSGLGTVHPHISAVATRVVQLQEANPGKEVLVLLDKDGNVKQEKVGGSGYVNVTGITGQDGTEIHTHSSFSSAFGFSWNDIQHYRRQKLGFRMAIVTPDEDPASGKWVVTQISGVPDLSRVSSRQFQRARDKLWDQYYLQRYQDTTPMEAAIRVNEILMKAIGLDVSVGVFEPSQ